MASNIESPLHTFKSPADPRTRQSADYFCTPKKITFTTDVISSAKWDLNGLLEGKRRICKTPCYPSPLDRIRSGKNRRAEALGLSYCKNSSFEGNQSFPRISRLRLRRSEIVQNPFHNPGLEMEKIRVDGSNGLRFSARKPRGCFTPGTSSPFSESFIHPVESVRVPQTGINPNKAVFTIDAKTSQILIVNSNACKLLGYSSKELCEMHFFNLLHNKHKSHVCALAEGQLNTDDGSMVLLSGKVVEMTNKECSQIAVSLWIRQLENDGPCIAVAEPVQRRVAQIAIDKSGYIISADSEATLLFQCDSQSQINGMEITELIPSIVLPENETSVLAKNIRKQKATGRTLDGHIFPLCLIMSHQDAVTESSDSGLSNNATVFSITIWVFSNLSGLIVIDETGTVESCNHHFSMLLFGHPQNKIIGQKITDIIPHFGQDIDYIEFSRSRNATLSSVGNESDNDTDPVCLPSSHLSPFHKKRVHKNLDKSKAHLSSIDTPTTKINELHQGVSKTSENIDLSKMSIEFTLPNITSQINEISLEGKTKDTKPLSVSKVIENCENDINIGNISSSFIVNTSSQKNLIDKDNPAIINKHVGVICLSDTEDIIDLVTPEKPTLSNPFTEKSFLYIDLDSTTENDEELLTPVNEMLEVANGSNGQNTPVRDYDDDEYSLQEDELSSDHVDDHYVVDLTETPVCRKRYDIKRHECLSTSTPEVERHRQSAAPQANNYIEGQYKGYGLHADGNKLDIQYFISNQKLPCGRCVYCVWLSCEPQEPPDQSYLTLTSSFSSTIDNSLGQAIKQTAAQNLSRPNSVSLLSQCEEEQASGDFGKNYTTLRQIGKGAYGYVKMAYRNSDRFLVIAKFILKHRVTEEFWIYDKDIGKKVPLEISLLSTLKHPNIVSVYDIYENEKFFQLVMEKHGSGMDLFEFIDRRPVLDEPLISYIFRQIAMAVDYLHSVHILHRDIKDENVIIDQNFHVKLIDFGSATFFRDGALFSTFYGTTEYCSPEVLAGNKYAGPELEMWAMGITLYVLTFFENPFIDVEDTLRGDLNLSEQIPVSYHLEQLLYWMLCKDPEKRCRMSELMASPWLHQNVDITKYDFSQVVYCEMHEIQPEKYFNMDPCSSITGLSSGMISPRDAVSLIDDDSLIEDQSTKSAHSHDDNVGENHTPVNIKISEENSSNGPSNQNLFEENQLPAKEESQPAVEDILKTDRDVVNIKTQATQLLIKQPCASEVVTSVAHVKQNSFACDTVLESYEYDYDSWDDCDQDSYS